MSAKASFYFAAAAASCLSHPAPGGSALNANASPAASSSAAVYPTIIPFPLKMLFTAASCG